MTLLNMMVPKAWQIQNIALEQSEIEFCSFFELWKCIKIRFQWINTNPFNFYRTVIVYNEKKNIN